MNGQNKYFLKIFLLYLIPTFISSFHISEHNILKVPETK